MKRSKAMWIAVAAIVCVAAILVAIALWPVSVGDIQVLESGPYNPGQIIVLSLPVDSRGTVLYSWSAPDGGDFAAPTNMSSTRFIVPSKGPVRAICTVIVNGNKYERIARVGVNATAEGTTTPTGGSAQIETGSSKAVEGEVLDGSTLSAGLDMGVDSSRARREWVKPGDGGLKLAFPGDPAWGAVFMTVGIPTDVNRPARDYSRYAVLELELRGERGGEKVDIGVKDWKQPDNGRERKSTVTLSKEWKTYKVRLADLAPVNDPGRPASDLKHLYVVCEFVFGPEPETIVVRRIRYSQ